MVTLGNFENQNFMGKSIVGENQLSAPVSGVWAEVSANEYESQVRQLAYGLLVKDYKRGNNVMILESALQATGFIEAGCKLAHLKSMTLSDSLKGEELIEVLRDSNVCAIIVMNKTEVEHLPSLIKSEGLNIDLYSVLGSDSKTSLNYLQRIGSTWELKYKSSVDRTMRELSFNS